MKRHVFASLGLIAFAATAQAQVAALPIKDTVLANGLRVIREGVTTADWVVVKGQQRVRPGQLVTAKRESIELSDAAPEPHGMTIGDGHFWYCDANTSAVCRFPVP